MIARRSLLFAPANRAEVHAKALAAGTDIVCLDLEDAVPPYANGAPHGSAISFLREAQSASPERVVRINALRSLEALGDRQDQN
jgi:citrate lyase beta subunit